VAAQTPYAFQRDLEACGLADRVLTLVWSELGCRVQENASAGTDHEAAGCAFVMGTRAAGAMIGEWPGLAKGLDALGNVKATFDFRGLYCSLLEQWLGCEAELVIPGAGHAGGMPWHSQKAAGRLLCIPPVASVAGCEARESGPQRFNLNPPMGWLGDEMVGRGGFWGGVAGAGRG
jgi:hypothetical protein